MMIKSNYGQIVESEAQEFGATYPGLPVINVSCTVCGTRRGNLYRFGDCYYKPYMDKKIRWVRLDTGERCGPPRVPFYTCDMCHMLHYLWSWYFEDGRLPRSKLKLWCLKTWKSIRRFFFDQRG